MSQDSREKFGVNSEEPDQHWRVRWGKERKERKDILRAGQSRGCIVYVNGVMHYKA